MTVTVNLFLSIQIIVHKTTQAQIDRHTNRQRTQTDTGRYRYRHRQLDKDRYRQTDSCTILSFLKKKYVTNPHGAAAGW